VLNRKNSLPLLLNSSVNPNARPIMEPKVTSSSINTNTLVSKNPDNYYDNNINNHDNKDFMVFNKISYLPPYAHPRIRHLQGLTKASFEYLL
jgi:hypothetical protein